MKPSVLHFIETGIPGGAERFLVDLCRSQMKLGIEPVIAHFAHPYFISATREFGIASLTLDNRSDFKKRLRMPRFALHLARTMRQLNICIMHSHLFGPIVGGSVAAFLAHIPHVGTLHDIHMIEDEPSRIWQLRASLLLSSQLVAVSRNMTEFYRKRLRWRASALTCIPNGIDPPPDTSVVQREGLAIPDGDAIAIIVGRLVKLKRTADALRAVAELRNPPALTLLVVGEGPEREALEALATSLGIGQRIRFLGKRDDVPALLRISDIFLQCSETEGLSMSIIEALHAGLPCIVSRVGGNPELVKDGENGTLFQTGDIPSLRLALESLITDPRRRAQMGARSRETALEYTVDSAAQRYCVLYRSLGLQLAP